MERTNLGISKVSDSIIIRLFPPQDSLLNFLCSLIKTKKNSSFRHCLTSHKILRVLSITQIYLQLAGSREVNYFHSCKTKGQTWWRDWTEPDKLHTLHGLLLLHFSVSILVCLSSSCPRPPHPHVHTRLCMPCFFLNTDLSCVSDLQLSFVHGHGITFSISFGENEIRSLEECPDSDVNW